MFKATSFSLAVSALIGLEGCGASSETSSTTGLCYYFYSSAKSALPEFHTYLFQTSDSSGQRLDVYLSLREARLKFEKTSTGYRAHYATTIRLHRRGGEDQLKELNRGIVKRGYPAASESSYDASLVSFRVVPGDYSVEIALTDEVSGQKTVRVFDKHIPPVDSSGISVSDILLLARYDTLGHGRKITPFLLRNAGLLGDSLAFFTVLQSAKSSQDSVWFKIYRLSGPAQLPSSFAVGVSASRGAGYDPCHTGVDTLLVYSFPSVADVDSGFSYIFGRVPKPGPGNYALRVGFADGNGHNASALVLFQVRNKSFPEISDDLIEMVNSLNYIASRSELQKITEVKTDSAIKTNIIKFWDEWGGRAKMIEYYQRVAQANRMFSTCLDGWRTPMGMFYIVCGPPDYVDCRGAFTERWMYVKSSTDERVIVDFRLTRENANPDDRYYGIENVYSNLDFWSYYVSRWRSPY